MMKKILAVLLLGSIICGMTSCSEKEVLGRYEYNEVNNIPAISSTVNIFEEDKYSPSDCEVLTEIAEQENTYQNPLLAPARGDGEQFGDPFVLRYNGKYYLYHTASVLNCWESEDLVHWNYVGVCTENDIFIGSWAPEVRYYNGTFYMTTTGPNGDGEYVLTSESPTGPFVIAAANVETNFDADLFIDDNGDWYVFYPKYEDICVSSMSSPLSPNHWTFKELGVTIAKDSWTEGPMVIKHKDTYFMTYCGGEVENTGYQIHYATSTGDMFNWVVGENNPIIINTDITTYPGLGHSSVVTGPNLDSMYKVYHSMPWSQQPRTMMIDPLYINGDYMQAMGPTLSIQQAPEMPDIYSRFDSEESLIGWTSINAEIVDSVMKLSEGGVVISENGIEGDFTAEYNFISIEDVYGNEEAFIPAYGKACAIFDYKDANNYGAAYIDTEASRLEVVFTVDGKEVMYKDYLVASFEDQFDFSKLQKLTVKKYGTKYRFLFNDITVGEYESSLAGGAIGVACTSGTASIGFVGIEGNVWHSSYKEFYKPIEGEFGALLCVENELNLAEYEGREYLTVNGGEAYNYYVNAEASGNYDFSIRYRSDVGFSFELYYNGKSIYRGSVPKTDVDRTEIFRGIELPQGYGILTFKITEGSADVFNYEFITSTVVSEQIIFDLSAPTYSEGEWLVENGEFITDMQAKMLYGDREWANYSVSATFTSKRDLLNSYMLFRVTNESLDPQDSTVANLHFYIGYYVALVNDGNSSYVALYKQNYGETELARFETELPFNTPIEVTVEAVDENIKVYIDGKLVIEYSDPYPFLKGAVGFANINHSKVRDLKIEPLFS